jgi:hypothetical protein
MALYGVALPFEQFCTGDNLPTEEIYIMLYKELLRV